MTFNKVKAFTLAILVFVAAACGGEGTDPPPGATTGPGATSGTGDTTPAQGTGSQNFPFESGTGYFEVDGERFVPRYIVSCIVPNDFFDNPPHPDDVDLRGHDLQDGIGLEVEVTSEDLTSPTDPEAGYTSRSVRLFLHRRGADGTEQYEGRAVTWTDGAWYDSSDLTPRIAVYSGAGPTGPPLPSPAGFEITGSRIQGTLTLTQSWPVVTGTVDVTFDYSIPAEFDCDEL